MNLVCFSLSLLLSMSSLALHVIIDPGHGGIDAGAVNGSIREADLTMQFAQKLKTFLDKDPQFTATLTRSQNQGVSLPERVRLAESKKGDILISLHANASFDKRARGIEVYFQSQFEPDEDNFIFAANEERASARAHHASSENFEPSRKNDILSIIDDLKRTQNVFRSHHLGSQIIKALEKSNKRMAHHLRQAPFYMVSMPNIPSVLIELGFITNEIDLQRLTSPESQTEVAHRIYQGLVAYAKSKDTKKYFHLADHKY